MSVQSVHAMGSRLSGLSAMLSAATTRALTVPAGLAGTGLKEKKSMQRTTRTMRFALKPVIGLALVSLSYPSLAAIPYHGTASNANTLWWITQTGLGGAGEFEITNASNSQPALYATTKGSGAGVQGSSTSGYGVYGTTVSGYSGVYGISTDKIGTYGGSFNSTGVVGENTNNHNVGLLGTPNYGVYGQSTSGPGVYGYTPQGSIGIYGKSDLAGQQSGEFQYTPGGIGVYGEDNQINSIGVSGQANGYLGTGVSGQANGSLGTGVSGYGASTGVYGASASTGVWGNSSSGTGVYGVSSSYYGVYGYTSTGYAGVFGTGNHNGVVGTTASGTDSGVFGKNTGAGIGAAGISVSGNGVYGASTSGYAGFFQGNVYVTGNVTCVKCNQTSDARYKQNIRTLPNALDTILALRGVSYDWRQNEFPQMKFDKTRQLGFIAQEVEKVVPELVSKDSKGMRSVAYTGVIPILVEAIKDQQQQIEASKAQIDALKAQNKQLTSLQTQFAALTTKLAHMEESRQASSPARDAKGLCIARK